MLNIKKYEVNTFQPVLHYWGFFINFFEIPSFGSIELYFRLRKKENVLLISFLSFFFKSIFLQEHLLFKVIKKSSDLYLVVKINKKNINYSFFFIFLQYYYFFCYNNKFNFKGENITKINKVKKKSFFLVTSDLFASFIFKLLLQDYIFPRYFYSNLYHMHNLFLNIFFSEKKFKLSLQTSLSYNVKKDMDHLMKKINKFSFSSIK